MLIALALLLAKPDLGPALLPGMNPYFHQAVLRVEESLAKKDFVAAARAVRMLPGNKLKIEWDDSKVPDADREAFEEARERAFGQFRTVLKRLEFELVRGSADVRIAFVGSIPKDQDAPLPPGAAFLHSEGPQDPRVEGVIALRRGNPLQNATAADVQNEVQYAVGLYLGLSQARVASTIMARTDLSRDVPNRFSLYDGNLAATAIRIGDQLRDAVEKKRVLEPAIPQIKMSTELIEPPNATQGDIVPMSVPVSNLGNAPLNLKLLPDCSCVSSTPALQLGPGDSGLIRIQIDTTEFPGDLRKHVVVFTNDPERPVLEIPIHLMVAHRYRFISPVGETVLMADGGADAEVFLLDSPKSKIKVLDARLDGVPADVTFEPWSGLLADPEAADPAPSQRSGYRFALRMRDVLPPGRASATLVVATDDPKFAELRFNLGVQKGIVAVPSMVYLGELKGPKKYDFLLSRPKVAFKVLGIDSDSKSLTATIAQVKGREGWEYRVSVSYDGREQGGKLEALLTVRTDDPKQPKLYVPIRGTIR